MTRRKLIGYLPMTNGHPAHYDGYQLSWGRNSAVIVPNLRIVRRQIQNSIFNRIADKLPADAGDYSYVRVYR